MSVSKLSTVVFLLGTIGLSCLLSGCHYLDRQVTVHEVVEKAVSEHNVPVDITASGVLSEGCGSFDSADTYRLGPEDVLKIRVFGEDDLSGRYAIDERGKITLPLIDEVAVSGCTVSEVKDKVLQGYSDGYLVNPSLSIEIASFRPFYIIGEVRVPGRYDYAVGMNVFKAAALAGGFTYRANKKTVEILRDNYNGQKIYHQQAIESDIQPGDIILIKERLF